MNEIIDPSGAKSALPVYKAPSLNDVVIERIRAGVPLDEAREYYRFAREVELDAAKIAFTKAMVKAQAEMSAVSKDMANPQTHSKYASLGAVDAAIRGPYTRNNLACSFDERTSTADNWIAVILDVSHISGYSREFRLQLPADGVGAKGGAVMTRTHATVAAITYARRALLKMAFNLSEVDDDGNAANKSEPRITEEQVEELCNMLEPASEGEWRSFLGTMKVAGIVEIPQSRFQEAKTSITRWLEKKNAAKNA